jgi:hypothetical protein
MNKKNVLSFVVSFCMLAFPLQATGLADGPPAASQVQSGPVAALSMTEAGLVWQPLVEASGWKLRVAGPQGVISEVKFSASEQPFFALQDASGEPLPDGVYVYELWGAPVISAEVRAQLEMSSDREALAEELQKAGKLFKAFYMGGVFTVTDGAAILPESPVVEEGQPQAEPLGPEDDVINDDLIVIGNACIGASCYDTYIFSPNYSPLVVRDDGPRIHFVDSSTVLPTNDWALVANDVADGGAAYFAIVDEDSSTAPFKIMDNAPANSIYISPYGDVGFGTSAPSAELDVVDDYEPSLRLEQTGGTPQVWEIDGDEWDISFYDVTHGAEPFKVEVGTPSNTLYIDSSGNVGIGTNAPSSVLHVTGSLQADGLVVEASTPANTLYVDSSGSVGIGTNTPSSKLHVAGNTYVTGNVGIGVASPAAKLDIAGGLHADGVTVETGTLADTLYVDSSGRVGIGTNAPTSKLHVAGNVYANGSLILDGFVNERSDVASKTAFAAVDEQQVLEQLASVPITTWSYKESPEVRHMGPMAQDFRAAYGLGTDEKHLAALDTNGVALAAIQALNMQVQEKDAQIQDLQARLKAVENRPAGGQIAPFAFGLLGVLVGMYMSRKKR